MMAWPTTSPNDKRIRGRKGVALRKARLATEPLCRHCKAEGITTVATEVDHIKPLSLGGEDIDTNCQSLCYQHHIEKTALDGVNTFAASNHPSWLKPSAIPLTIVCGPPASGKTTFVNENAEPTDQIICLDNILTELQPNYQHWQRSLNPTLFNKAIRLRNARLGGLAKADRGRAWFIASAPSKAERDWWRGKLGGDLVLLHPGAEECKRRAEARGTGRAIAGIDEWERKSKSPWVPKASKAARTTIGTDGWPIE